METFCGSFTIRLLSANHIRAWKDSQKMAIYLLHKTPLSTIIIISCCSVKVCIAPPQVISDIVKSNYNSQEAAVEATPTATPTATPYKTVHSVTPAPAITKDEKEKLPEKGEEEREDTIEKTEFEDGLTSSGSDGSVPDPDCTECGLVHPDPTPDQLMMYLHALRYAVSCETNMLNAIVVILHVSIIMCYSHWQGLDWEYCADMPSWAESGDKSLTDSGENDQKPLEKSNDKSLEKVADNQAKSGEKERAKSGEKEQAKSGETSKKTII